MRHLTLAAAFIAAAAGTAAADPSLDRVDSAVMKGRRLDVTVEATLTKAGKVTVSGDVNGRTVTMTKRVRTGHKTFTFKVDAKKLRLRKLTTGLNFNLTAQAVENGGTPVTQSVTATIPLPCVVLPGFGNETTPGAFATTFGSLLNATMGGTYTLDGSHPTMVVHDYASQTQSLASLGKDVGKLVKAALKGTVFTKVDLIGYSYGGLVARSYLSQGGGSKVKNCIFLATPNEGTPIAYVAVGLSSSGQLDTFLGQNAQLAGIAQQLLTADAKASLRNMYPTYSWATITFLGSTIPVPTQTLEIALGSSSTPLTALNAIDPPAGVTFNAFYYTSTGVGQFGTVDKVDVTGLIGGQTIDPATIANGSGDGVAPAHSVTMDEFPHWAGVIVKHDMGVGSHLTIPVDVNVMAGVAAILGQ